LIEIFSKRSSSISLPLSRKIQYLNRLAKWLTDVLVECTLDLIKTRRKSGSCEFSMQTPYHQHGEISDLLAAWSDGDPGAWDSLVPIVYGELRQQAHIHLRRERGNHTLRTTALVQETYMKLADQRSANWENRAHFFWLASEMMRRVLVDYARGRNRQKRGGDVEIVPLESAFQIAIDNSEVDLLELDTALRRLAVLDAQQAKVVEVRYFGGCSLDETASILGISVTTVKRDWASAKAWLKRELNSHS
jgi:RNA polymerase sigma-70 factor (ECF subfamily)